MIAIAIDYLRYILFSRHKYGHGIHSPFVYDYIRNVLVDKRKYEDYKLYKDVYNEIASSFDIVIVDNNEAGAVIRSPKRKLSKIIKNESTPAKYSFLIYRTAKYFGIGNILELGTSLGLNTLLLSKTCSNLYSFEISTELANYAKNLLSKNNIRNVDVRNASIDKELVNLLNEIEKIDLVYFDANHTEEATIRYFKICLEKAHADSVFIFDDINWSQGMKRAWKRIKKDERVKISIDLFRMGIVFFREGIVKQDFVIRF